ncbi:MAG: hypothetical protein HY226_00970 [Candidatus Vogelbacteria bacterium]|nr:hypothetical protein [Candidatus Vogelbacteria bacterium]
MPSLIKLLKNFSGGERKVLDELIEKIMSLDWDGLDLKKLKRYQNVFRVRKGTLRIIFSKIEFDIKFLTVERRSDTTYNF